MPRIVRGKQRRAGDNRVKSAFQNEGQHALMRDGTKVQYPPGKTISTFSEISRNDLGGIASLFLSRPLFYHPTHTRLIMRIPSPRKMHRTLRDDRYVVPVLALALLFAACGPQETTPGSSSSAGVAETMRTQENTRAPNPLKNLYWGDTHVHTAMSPDAYFFNNTTATPDVAYRYAKGFPVVNASNGVRIQIGTPLDFLVVADHAEYLAVPMRIFNDKQASLVETDFGQRLIELWEKGERRQAAAELIGTINENRPYAPFLTDAIKQPPWATIIEAAERANEPGTFTAFIGWEWTSFPNASNLHRVLFTPHSATEASTFLPFTALDSSDPEDLWNWLQETSTASGADFISIPHNGNVSNGLMFSREDFEGNPITAQYAQLRARWEPIYEITQIKGDSETHPLLSPTDEFADFETYAHLLDAAAVASAVKLPRWSAKGTMPGVRYGWASNLSRTWA